MNLLLPFFFLLVLSALLVRMIRISVLASFTLSLLVMSLLLFFVGVLASFVVVLGDACVHCEFALWRLL